MVLGETVVILSDRRGKILTHLSSGVIVKGDSVSPLFIPEHDNLVQFRNIRINTDWLPIKDGAFDTGWQANP